MNQGMSTGGAVAIGLCPICGAEIGGGEAHAESCAEDTFVDADPEYRRLEGAERDARDACDYLVRRSRPSARGQKIAIARSKLERCQRQRRVYEAELRWRFRHKLNIVEATIVLAWLDRAAASIERLTNEESCEPTHVGTSHYTTRALALQEAAKAVRALKPKEE